MPTARCCLGAATGADGRIYAIGGLNDIGGWLNTVEVYNPATNAWSTVAPMPTARCCLAAATGPDGRIYAIGGLAKQAREFDTVEAYDPSTNAWSTVAPMPASREDLAAAAGQNGRIYVVGGYTLGVDAKALEAYTPAPLFVRVTLAHRVMAGGQMQTVTIATWPHAHVAITVAFPNHGRKQRTGRAGPHGVFIWSYRQPRVGGAGRRVARVTVMARAESGASATGRKTYRIGVDQPTALRALRVRRAASLSLPLPPSLGGKNL